MLDGTYVGQNIKISAFTAPPGYDASNDDVEVGNRRMNLVALQRYTFKINEDAGYSVYDWYDEVDFPGFHKKNIKPFQ